MQGLVTQTCQHTPVGAELSRLRQEDFKFMVKVKFCCTKILSENKTKQTQKDSHCFRGWRFCFLLFRLLHILIIIDQF